MLLRAFNTRKFRRLTSIKHLSMFPVQLLHISYSSSSSHFPSPARPSPAAERNPCCTTLVSPSADCVTDDVTVCVRVSHCLPVVARPGEPLQMPAALCDIRVSAWFRLSSACDPPVHGAASATLPGKAGVEWNGME